MRLAIADPPYLGRAEMWYGSGKIDALIQHGRINRPFKPDIHPEAARWDDPATHREMVADLIDRFDGWAIALLPTNLHDYLQWVPRNTRIAVWHDPRVMPTGSHPRRRWEVVLVSVPPGRRRVVDVPNPVGDVFTCPHGSRFAGAKPAGWTRWVLDMLGYDQDTDTVTDLFRGSGAVVAEIAQRTLTWPAP